ncbi:3-(3-hydroxyphenyl)propionate hydroxylase [Haematobacter genomosp. 1]|uniref:3-(3-hydroxyphenyl)propionate hydroxylase n=1 Tax=Haematobacter genomosp. 1 TaxID=366618 RepID=A0A212AAI7_9RHOB|nr:3-(3-hydroxyphenyl)propionate hydroxylase [Haematobacter genomosp. 1]
MQHDVAIIGLGPVGATLANILGQAGIDVLVLEREPEAYHLPRAVHFDDEVMRTFQQIGVAKTLEQVCRFNIGMRFVDPEGGILLDWPRPRETTPLGWRSSYRFHQPDLERILRQRLAAHPGVTRRTRCEAFFLAQDADGVDLRWEDMARGRIERARVRYVVGCDGARSFVRRFIETGMEDLGFHERWLVADILLKGEKPELGDWSLQHCDPARPATYIRGPQNRRRWELTVLPGEDSAEIARPENVWPLLARWITPEEAEIERTAVYWFHSLVATDWQRDRLFIAGDAAHQTPPFMGQGMCAGIRDVANLGWKLIHCLTRGHDPALLASYTSERRPNARDYIATAVRLGGLINTRDPATALSHAFPRAEGGARMEAIYPPIGPGLMPEPSTLTAQPRLTDGRRLDDSVGYGFALVVEDGFWEGLPADLRRDADALCTVVPGSDMQGGDALLEGAGAAVIRPDRYLLGRAASAQALREVLGRIPRPAAASGTDRARQIA